MALDDTLDQLDLIDSYRTLHIKTREYTSSSYAHETLSRLYDILGHEMSLNKFKRTEIISSIFFEHNSMILEINYKKKNGKNTDMWIQNKMLLKRTGGQQRNLRGNQKIH